VDLAGQQRIIADPQAAVGNLLEGVARAKGFEAASNSVGQSFAEAIGLLRGLIADLVLPGVENDDEFTEGEPHHEHGDDDRDDR